MNKKTMLCTALVCVTTSMALVWKLQQARFGPRILLVQGDTRLFGASLEFRAMFRCGGCFSRIVHYSSKVGSYSEWGEVPDEGLDGDISGGYRNPRFSANRRYFAGSL